MTNPPGSPAERPADLPSDVLAALHAHRKIEAIRLLREHRGLGLRDAKQTVDAYLAAHPRLTASRSDKAESGLGRLLVIGIIAAIAYGMYRSFVAN